MGRAQEDTRRAYPASDMAGGRSACSVGSCAGADATLSSGSGSRHAPAFIGASPASLGAFLAMLHLMSGAFVAAGFANFRACLAKQAGHFAAAGHISRSQAADLCAIHVEGNTAGHGFWIGFLQAGCRAMVAGCRTIVARFDTGLELLMRHGFLHKRWQAWLTNYRPGMQHESCGGREKTDRLYKPGTILSAASAAWKKVEFFRSLK